jgi:uncharacterized protein (TIGR03435 family)
LDLRDRPSTLDLMTRCTLRFLGSVAILVWAQSPAAPTFDVASIKPVKPEVPLQRPFGCGFGAGGRFRAFGTVQWLIACAYRIPAARAGQEILQAPKWLDSDLFDIEATSPPDGIPHSSDEGLPMIRTLLAERFKLVVHRETRELPMYALVIVRRDGRLGPRLHRTADDCAAWIANGRQGAPPPGIDDLPCGRNMVTAYAYRSAAMPLSQLANLLSPRVERPVKDQTGLTGTFALDLQWRPEQAQPGGSPDSLGVSGSGRLDDLPTSIFTALQEQLGLKLQPTKGRMDVLVIDHVERPTSN